MTTSGPEVKKSLILKFEYAGTLYELSSLTPADKVGDLRAVVCSILNIDEFDRINLKTVQPTRIIDASEDGKPLSEIFHGIRERMVVEDVESMKDHYNRESSNPATKYHKSGVHDPFDVTHDSNQIQAISGPSRRPEVEDSDTERTRKVSKDQSDLPVCSSTGYLLRHPVPSNNSCLFISVHFCLTNGIVDDQIGKSMRKIIAETVAADKDRFDDAFLGKSNSEYCRWILDDNNWGGAIELSILCKYYETEIVAIDIKNTLLNRFGEDSHYPRRMLLLYDGLHYDPLKFQPLDDTQSIQTLFSSDNLEVLALAKELAKEANQSHQFTDVNKMTMKCATCGVDLDQSTARDHAAKTGHVDFVEKS